MMGEEKVEEEERSDDELEVEFRKKGSVDSVALGEVEVLFEPRLITNKIPAKMQTMRQNTRSSV